ncbi:MAG: cell division protein ZapA [Spirochaetaceae bacterium]|jgi:cell division protein ZapA (FtsZ GTPase activity inhibitor)|nr:cell division protein ZapA [Spirochaetaceae bacterium]
MEKSDLRIDLLGTSLSIAADEDRSYLESLLNRYRIVIENTRKSTGLQDPLKLAILTGFLLCDEIEKIKKQDARGEREGREVEQLTLDLIARIDEAIPGGGEP